MKLAMMKNMAYFRVPLRVGGPLADIVVSY